jgi:hypothetical protein
VYTPLSSFQNSRSNLLSKRRIFEGVAVFNRRLHPTVEDISQSRPKGLDGVEKREIIIRQGGGFLGISG